MNHDGLAATGERTAPGLADEEYWFARHVAGYAALPRLLGTASQGRVIDAGAGEGYGASALLAAGAQSVLALEYDAPTCLHASRAYAGVRVARANLDALPVRSGSVDAVVSCQVIEHLWDLPRFLRECRRVLRHDGVAVVTTPNRLTFSPGLLRGERPINPFHVEEFDADQVEAMLRAAGFPEASVMGLHHGPRLREWERHYGSLVQNQVDAVLSGTWPGPLRDMVATVTPADFEVRSDDIDECADLIGIARVRS